MHRFFNKARYHAHTSPSFSFLGVFVRLHSLLQALLSPAPKTSTTGNITPPYSSSQQSPLPQHNPILSYPHPSSIGYKQPDYYIKPYYANLPIQYSYFPSIIYNPQAIIHHPSPIHPSSIIHHLYPNPYSPSPTLHSLSNPD